MGMITAHSGCDGTADNSMEYIRYALELPVDAFEADIRRDGAGRLILSHDETEADAAGLEDVFALLREHPEKKINCDLKQNGLEAEVLRLAREYSVDKQLIFTGSVNAELFAEGAKEYSDVLWYANIACFPAYEQALKRCAADEDRDTVLRELLKHMRGYQAAGLNWRYTDAERIWTEAAAMGVGVSIWTVDDAEEQLRWLARNVENITTRKASQLIGMREELSGK